MIAAKVREYKLTNKVYLHTKAVVRSGSFCLQAHVHVDTGDWWEVSISLGLGPIQLSVTLDGDDYPYNYKEDEEL
jgi:hypothetical protein